MNLERYFSVPLFREGLRRLALPAVGLGIAVLLINTLGLVSDFAHGLEEIRYDDYPYGLQLCPMLFPYMMLAPLLLGLWQFRFLNHKDSVDFFFAAPATRAALFNSFSVAGVVLQWLTIAIGVVAGALLYHGYGVRLHAVDVVHAIFTCGVGAFLGWAITACAVAVCSGALATMALAAIACFGPAILQLIIEAFLHDVSSSTFVWPQALSVTNHLFIDVFVNDFASGGARTLVYTLALAAGYYLLGVYAFARRHGESGSHPGVVYPELAAAALFLAVLAPVLGAAVGFVSKDSDNCEVGWKFDWEPHELALACGMLALGFYALAYCFVRRLRPLLRLTLLVPLALAVAALVVMGGLAWGERFRKVIPAADAVAAVTFLPYEDWRSDDSYDFAGLRTTDPRVCQRAAASLARVYKPQKYKNANDPTDAHCVARLELRDGTLLTRNVSFWRTKNEPKLQELLRADPANAAYWRLPGAGQVCGFDLQIGWQRIYFKPYRQYLRRGFDLRGDAPQWEAYRQEYAAAIANDLDAVVFFESNNWERMAPAVDAKFRDRHGRIVERSLPIIPRLMPKTRDWLLEAANHPFPILSKNDREHAWKFTFCDLDAIDEENANWDISHKHPNFRARLADFEKFLAPIQARHVAPGEIAKYHLAYCKLLTDQPRAGKQKGVTEEYDDGRKTAKHYFLFMNPEEIAKLRELLGRE
ncbi:MAG: hypothetical protein J6333_11195 [Planctomycetes bacterium]|nr:hypothetical protein [Planctomycetota bacterium]